MKESKFDTLIQQFEKLNSNLCRRYLIMEDQYKQMETEYNEKKEKIKLMIPSEEDYHQWDV
jgi:hypothetical protein